MKQRELGQKAGLPQSTISNLEKGNGNPTLAQILKLSHFFEVPLSKMFQTSRDQIETYDIQDIQNSAEDKSFERTDCIEALPIDFKLNWHSLEKEEIKTLKCDSHRQVLVCVISKEAYVRVKALSQIQELTLRQFALVPGGYEIDLISYPEDSVLLTLEMPRKEGR